MNVAKVKIHQFRTSGEVYRYIKKGVEKVVPWGMRCQIVRTALTREEILELIRHYKAWVSFIGFQKLENI